MYGYVYLTTNTINNKKYIGQHKCSIFDEKYVGSGILLSRAVEKYGINNFQTKVIQWCSSREELNQAEISYIQDYDAINSLDFYNIASGGEGGNTYAGLSEQEIEEISKKKSETWKSKTKEEIAQIKSKMTSNKDFIESRKKVSEMCSKRVGENHPNSKRIQLIFKNTNEFFYSGKEVCAFLKERYSIEVTSHFINKQCNNGVYVSRYEKLKPLDGMILLREEK